MWLQFHVVKEEAHQVRALRDQAATHLGLVHNNL